MSDADQTAQPPDGMRFDPATQELVPIEPDEPRAAGGRAPLESAGNGDQGAPAAAAEPAEPANGNGGETEEEREAAASRRSELAGKRIILVRDSRAERSADYAIMWALLVTEDGSPQTFEGDPDQARSAALEAPANKELAEMCSKHPGTIMLAAPPASSWAPEAASPRAVTTAWRFG